MKIKNFGLTLAIVGIIYALPLIRLFKPIFKKSVMTPKEKWVEIPMTIVD